MKVKEQIKELEAKSARDLQEMLTERREQMRDLRFKISQNQEKNVRQLRKIKKEIARILTIIKAKGSDMTGQK